MATDYRFVAGGVTYYLKPSRQAATNYTGSGTPWTSPSTTPFELQMNDVTGGRFNPRPSLGARLVGVGPNVPTLTTTSIEYETVEWRVPFAIRASTREFALDAKQVLLRALDNWAVGLPAQMHVKPDAVTTAVYWEILGASWLDSDQSWNEEHGYGFLRSELTLLVREFGGRDASNGDGIFSSQSFNNTETTDTRSMGSSVTGDLTNEGQPINIQVVPSATNARFYLASVYDRSSHTSGFSGTTVTTSYTTVGSGSVNAAGMLTRPNLAARLIVRGVVSSTGSTDYIDGIKALLNLDTGGTYHTVEFPAISVAVNATGRLYDFGDIPIPILPFNGHSTTSVPLAITIQMRKSSAVDTVTCTLTYIELLTYYEFCVVSGSSVSSAESMTITSFPVQTGRTSLPLPQPIARRLGSAAVRFPLALEGDAPRYRAGTSLWLAMTTEDQPAGLHNTGHTMTVTAQACPLWRSTRAD